MVEVLVMLEEPPAFAEQFEYDDGALLDVDGYPYDMIVLDASDLEIEVPVPEEPEYLAEMFEAALAA